MSVLRPDTIKLQEKMASYCRQPAFTDVIEGSKSDRLHNYRRLVFNIIEDTLSDAYPITRSMMDDEEWMDLVNAFFSKHNCQSTQLWRMPFELVEFVEEDDYHTKIGRPYLLELLYFEWLEIEVYQSPDKPHKEFTIKGDILNNEIVVNPDHKIVQLSYPLHKKNHSELESQKGIFYVLLFRHRETYSVNFYEMSPFLVQVFTFLAQNEITLKNALLTVGKANGVTDENMLYAHGEKFGKQLLENTAILGFFK
jgi:hypothetical protein